MHLMSKHISMLTAISLPKIVDLTNYQRSSQAATGGLTVTNQHV
jgi:hypothetical protein